MIFVPLLRTRRLTAQFRELTIGESIALAGMPPGRFEAETTAFLRAAVESCKGVPDPANWTVQERMLGVCHYLAATAPDGPDFSLGEGRYSDYLDGSKDFIPGPVEAGSVGGDTWLVRHLTGAMAESIERVQGEVEGISGRLHWLLGSMAAQMILAGEEPVTPEAGEGSFDEFLVSRMRAFSAYPESDFALLLAFFSGARESLTHLFSIEVTEGGLVALPKGGDASELPPARFPVASCLSRFAKDLAG